MPRNYSVGVFEMSSTLVSIDLGNQSMASESILRTTGLGKRFNDRWAVRNMNLEVCRGDIFGFLGPNGAGKSTTVRMMLSLINPTEGEISLFGRSLKRERGQALELVGGIVERPDFYLYVSAAKNLEFIGALHGGVSRRRIDEVLDLVGLLDRANDKVRTYSHGMKQRLGIAQALLSNPELVILDEPTNGLDPQGMKEVRDLVVHLARDQERTVFLSSHLLNEIEMIATRMAIIHKGEIVVQGEVQKLLNESERYIILKGEPKDGVATLLREQSTIVRKFNDVEDGFEVSLDFSHIPLLTKMLVDAGIKVHAIIPRRSLEDFFLSMTEGEPKPSSGRRVH